MKNKNRILIPVFVSLLLATFSVPVQADETEVRNYFRDLPAMIDIARCESGFRQYTDSGNVLRGGDGGKMLGVFQLHSDYHLLPAQGMGMDITTLDGNLAYARHLYGQEGLKPWSPCLGAVSAENLNPVGVMQTTATATPSELERTRLEKKIKELQMQVYTLQLELLKMQLANLQ